MTKSIVAPMAERQSPARVAFVAISAAANSAAEASDLLRLLGNAFSAPNLDQAANHLAGRLTGAASRAVRAAVLAELDEETQKERDARTSRELLDEYDDLVRKGASERKAPGIVARRRSSNPVERANMMRRIRDHRARRNAERLRSEA